MFIPSICCGCMGSYDVCGIPVRVENGDEEDPPCLVKLFWSIIGRYTCTFVHEMGHALAGKLLIDSDIEVVLFTNCGGHTLRTLYYYDDPPWKNTVVSAAGPMAGVAYSFCQLIAAVALQNICWPAAVVLGGGGMYNMYIQLYCNVIMPALNSDNGDFGRIAQRGAMHLFSASVALIVEVALGIFVAARCGVELYFLAEIVGAYFLCIIVIVIVVVIGWAAGCVEVTIGATPQSSTVSATNITSPSTQSTSIQTTL